MTNSLTAQQHLEQLIARQPSHYRQDKINRLINFIDVMIEHEPLTVRQLSKHMGKAREIIRLFNQLGLLEKVGYYDHNTSTGHVSAIEWQFSNKMAVYRIAEMLWDQLEEETTDET